MKKYLYIFTVVFCCSSCLRLDDQLFNNRTIDEYRFDEYTGGKELPFLPGSYSVADSMKQLFSLTSAGKDENATIWAVYTGNMQTIATDTVILYCHGNSDHMDKYWNRVKLLAHTGGKHRYGVMTLDYRGYGKSEGKPSEDNMYADVDAALKWLQSKGVTGNRLIIYGYSLGSAPACEISAGNYTLKPAKLILEAPFASAQVMVNDGSKLALPASYFTNLKIDNAEEIKKISQPFLWIHGDADDFLSIKNHGEVVYKNYRGVYGEACRIKGATHINVPEIIGYQSYNSTLAKFIEK